MTNDELKTLLDTISQALVGVDNCIATDDVTAQEDDTHWRVDMTEALAAVDRLEKLAHTSEVPDYDDAHYLNVAVQNYDACKHELARVKAERRLLAKALEPDLYYESNEIEALVRSVLEDE